MKKIIIIVSYYLLWIIFAEKLTIQSGIIGIFIVILLINYNNDLLSEYKFVNFFRKLKYYIFYIVVLIYEVIKANIQVAIIVLSRKPNLSPCIVEHETNLKNNFYKMILANSITLTPGTLTISVNNNVFKVHCLKESFKDGVYNSKFEKILIKIEELNNAV